MYGFSLVHRSHWCGTQVVKQLKVWGFLYVENFVWVKKHVNNRIVTDDSAYFRKSKLSLHIFRRAVQEQMELRHQRTAVRFWRLSWRSPL